MNGINFIIDGCILTAICDKCMDPGDGPRVVERDDSDPPPSCMRCGKAFEVKRIYNEP